ncbi:MAG: family 16 glycoside hydrolase [Verrucomicrobiota bacterium]|nr:family 16 glycoside hydrolase [Verrucomicrobiota bacterium]
MRSTHHNPRLFQAFLFCCILLSCQAAELSLFNGRNLDGWEGNRQTWRVEQGSITGGSLAETTKENDFLCTEREFTNFIVQLQFKLSGAEGFINSGIQIRSKRVPGSHEVAGYQCDLGDPDWWGAIYDEARRNRVLFPTDMVAVNEVVRRGDWNDYKIRADGPRITVWLNGVRTADYYEEDPSIPNSGVIAIQLHGGGKAMVQVREIKLTELPATRPEDRFIGAAEPKPAQKTSPLKPEEQRASFSLPEGFEIELVASEEQGVEKPVTVSWDERGRLWTMTAVEYPVDANDNKELAEALYRQPGKDKVLIFDNPYGENPGHSRVFADGLAIPLGLLPYKDGAFVQHGPDIVFLRDTNNDGKADQREMILTGFGVGDSHLMPHQFTRAPGGWILVAQGAFNYSQVKLKSGDTHRFDQTLLGRFTPDGMRMETLGYGPCNIWGLVMTREGELFIQEANDYGYPAMPFHEGACYPGCTPFPKPYAPPFPGTSRLPMGGTGLSGLALSDAKGAYPGAYANTFYIANPITRRIQAVKFEHEEGEWKLIKLPDFVTSSDEWFRPVSIQFGPDGCLYIVDWYNKVISHNEISRNHPDRDKTRGRIWRVRHKEQKRFHPTHFGEIAEEKLMELLGTDSIWNSHAAWQAIVDRNCQQLVPQLRAVATRNTESDARRVQALWALDGLKAVDLPLLNTLVRDGSRHLRRETVKVALASLPANIALPLMLQVGKDGDPEVRAEVVRSCGRMLMKEPAAFPALMELSETPVSSPKMRSTHNGQPILTGKAYGTEFRRYLIRSALENASQRTAEFLASDAGKIAPIEGRLLAALALQPEVSASFVAEILPQLTRIPSEEEILRLAGFPSAPGVAEALGKILANPTLQATAVETLVRGVTRLKREELAPLLSEVAGRLLRDPAQSQRGLHLAAAFQLKNVENEIIPLLDAAGDPQTQMAALRALKEIGADQGDLYAKMLRTTSNGSLRAEALNALASVSSTNATGKLLELWPSLKKGEQQSAMSQLAGHKPGREQIFAGLQTGTFQPDELPDLVIEKMISSQPERKEELTALLGGTLFSTLRLDGSSNGNSNTDIDLQGPFTIETWIRLDEGIGNEDGILGRPGGADFNFADGFFRLYGGPQLGDLVVATRKMTAGLWTHLAVTRNDSGEFRIYIDGELNAVSSRKWVEPFDDLDIGRVTPQSAGTSALLAEFRVWNLLRSPEQIRRDFDRSLRDAVRPLELTHYYQGTNWGLLRGSAAIITTIDAPPLLTAVEVEEFSHKFEKFHQLAERKGNAARGREIAAICFTCHAVHGEGGNIGPNLNGAGAMGREALLRSILTPNAAMEAGYRIYRVQLHNEELLDTFFVSETEEAIIVRIPGSQDRRIPRSEIRKAGFIRRSLMPEGLLEGLPEEDVTDLLTYLQAIK